MFLQSLKYPEPVYSEAVAQTCSAKKGVLKIVSKFTEKHMCQSAFYTKVNFIKKETPTQLLPYNFCEIFKNTFFKEHLR